jgi:DNA polymerase elongation subunit (family B)
MRQQARKILLNSLYGALLNEACKFYDQRMGQSVTLTGRSISRHMNSMVNYEFTGIVDYRGDAVIYADTDSSYFSCIPVMGSEFFIATYPNFEVTKDSIIKLYDDAADRVNATFPPFMDKAFNTTLERGAIIKAGREIVALKGLFIKKKKYACLLYDKEGERYDVNGKAGKIKAMGLDLKRADTPKMMQKFLNEVLMDLLTGHTKDEIFGKILNFRRDFKRLPSWEKGTPRKVNGLTKYREKAESAFAEMNALKLKVKDKKMTMPGHVDASLNWNKLVKMNHDTYSTVISDGQKVIVCKMKPGPLKMKAVAYPIDQMHLPEWFKEMTFDDDEMENVIIDKKLNNLVDVLGWDLTESRDDNYADDFFVWD